MFIFESFGFSSDSDISIDPFWEFRLHTVHPCGSGHTHSMLYMPISASLLNLVHLDKLELIEHFSWVQSAISSQKKKTPRKSHTTNNQIILYYVKLKLRFL